MKVILRHEDTERPYDIPERYTEMVVEGWWVDSMFGTEKSKGGKFVPTDEKKKKVYVWVFEES